MNTEILTAGEDLPQTLEVSWLNDTVRSEVGAPNMTGTASACLLVKTESGTASECLPDQAKDELALSSLHSANRKKSIPFSMILIFWVFH